MQKVLRLWRKHFSTLLQGDEDVSIPFTDVVPNTIDDNRVEISPPSYEVIKVAQTAATGPDGVPVELKIGCNELVGCMH